MNREVKKDNIDVRVGITHGDLNGIGYEIIIKSLYDQRMLEGITCLLYTSPSPRDRQKSRMPSSA
jgi:4-hydroxy-L-threonine phosphate dehydrogenase PdxA